MSPFDLYQRFGIKGRPRLVVERNRQGEPLTVEYHFDQRVPSQELTILYRTAEGVTAQYHTYDAAKNQHVVETEEGFSVTQLDDLGRPTTEYVYAPGGALKGYGVTEYSAGKERYVYDAVTEAGERRRRREVVREHVDDRVKETVFDIPDVGEGHLIMNTYEDGLLVLQVKPPGAPDEDGPTKLLTIHKYAYVFGWQGNWTARRVASLHELTMQYTVVQLTERRYDPA